MANHLIGNVEGVFFRNLSTAIACNCRMPVVDLWGAKGTWFHWVPFDYFTNHNYTCDENIQHSIGHCNGIILIGGAEHNNGKSNSSGQADFHSMVLTGSLPYKSNFAGPFNI